jgi:serine/threonine protein kinase
MQYVPGISLETLFTELAALRPETINGASILEIVDRHTDTPIAWNPKSLRFREFLAQLSFQESVVWIGSRLADALAYAHERGVLHLDVKPSNILINPYGRPLLSDFSVSIEQRPARHMKTAQSTVSLGGTLDYMSPEQRALFDRDLVTAFPRIDGRSDVYSLGHTLRELLHRVTDRIEEPIRDVLDRSTHPIADERFATCDEMALAFEGCLEWLAIDRHTAGRGPLTHSIARSPFLSLFAVSLLPQLLGSLVHNAYNLLAILPMLTAAQATQYVKLLWIYNAAGYAVCGLGIWWPLLARLRRDIRRATTYAITRR